jgi:hypothetical protein
MEAKPSLARAFFIDGKTETEAVEKADLYQVSLIMPISPIADADRHDFARHVDKLVPGKAAVVQNVFVRFEDAV